MNKFLKRIKQSERKSVQRVRIGMERDKDDLQALEEFGACWGALEQVRRKAERAEQYARGDQWGDLINDPDGGGMMTERNLIKKQGKVPLQNNMIWPIVNNVVGQFRTAVVKPVCTVRDQREAKLGEMMSVAIEYVHDINEMEEVDASTIKSAMTSGIMLQRLEYGPNPAKGNRTDVWVYNIDPQRVFFNTSVEDARLWDITHIGEVMDMPLEQVIAEFAHSVADEERIREIYGNMEDVVYRDSYGMTERKDITFYSSSRTDMCRVILGWRLESRQAIYCHDTLKGVYYYIPRRDKHLVDAENERRRREDAAHGVMPEDMLLIDTEYMTERYWVYRYLTPDGYCLQRGRSPYWHGGHNYAIGMFNFVGGRIYNFVEQFIDQQRSINRTAMLIDFMRSASAKGLLVVDEDAFDSMTREEIVDEYVRYNGVLFVKPKQGVRVQDVIHQFNGAASTAGDYELLNLQLKLINEISGVNSAMQGQTAPSGTPSSLYAQQVQNSSLNLKDVFSSMRAFRRRRDTKVMNMIQQYYEDVKYLNIAGVDYSEEAKMYNPEKVQTADYDLTLTDGNNSPAYQVLANDFLMQLYQAQAIDVKTMLENSSYPFAAKILEAVKRNEQAMQEQQQMMQVPQMPVQSAQMERAMDDSYASDDDGVKHKSEE